MTFLKLIPVIISSLLLAAHVSRAGLQIPAVCVLFFPTLLLLPRPWVARLTQIVLGFAALEWVRTTLTLVAARRELDQPWTRLAVILGCVALFTLLSACSFSLSPALRERYGLRPEHTGT